MIHQLAAYYRSFMVLLRVESMYLVTSKKFYVTNSCHVVDFVQLCFLGMNRFVPMAIVVILASYTSRCCHLELIKIFVRWTSDIHHSFQGVFVACTAFHQSQVKKSLAENPWVTPSGLRPLREPRLNIESVGMPYNPHFLKPVIGRAWKKSCLFPATLP